MKISCVCNEVCDDNVTIKRDHFRDALDIHRFPTVYMFKTDSLLDNL